MISLAEMSIRTKLRVGLGILAGLVFLLAVLSVYEINLVSDLTLATHNHPLAVSNALRDIRTGIFAIHRDLTEAIAADEPVAAGHWLQKSRTREEGIGINLALVQERYLGDPADVAAFAAALDRWRSLRAEALDLIDRGEVRAAKEIAGGRLHDQVMELETLSAPLMSFAAGKADEFIAESRRIRDRAHREALILAVLATLLAVGIGVATARSIVGSFDPMIAAVGAVAEGDFTRKVPIRGRNELTLIGESINAMIDRLQATMVSVRDLNAEVAERRKVEDVLRRREQEMADNLALTASIYDTSPIGLCFLDTELRFVMINDLLARFNGVPKEDHLGRTVRQVLPALADTIEPLYRRVLEERAPLVRHQFVAATPAAPDDPRHWEISYYPVLEKGEVIGINTLVNDVTDQVIAADREREMEQKILHTQKLESLGILAGGIAHDFNNLLMSILGNADIALSDLSPVSPLRENIHDIEKASRRAADLCRQMLAYSGKGRFVLELIDLSEVVRELSHMLEVSISKKAVLKYEFAPDLPPILGDVTQIRQVVLNLIVNSSEAIGDRSGVIALRTGVVDCTEAYLKDYWMTDNLTPGLYTYLEVSDTGCGMDQATKERIFEPFFTTKFTGRGLGMAAVMGIVRGHKGAIKVYSELDRGTTFKILFPAQEGDPSLRADAEGEAQDDWRGTGRVLLVDDEESVGAIGKRLLERMGFQVHLARDGRDALAVLEEIDPVCVLLDLTMPHLDGEQTFREIRLRRPGLPVVMTSGYNEQEITQRFVGKGLAGFIQKPYCQEELRDVMRSALERG